MMHLSAQKKRVMLLLAGVPFLFCLFNYLAEKQFFGTYDKAALVISTAIVVVLATSFGQTLFDDGENLTTLDTNKEDDSQ
jgi:hypothetical protein